MITATAQKPVPLLRPLTTNPFILFIMTYFADKHLPVPCAPLHVNLCDLAYGLLQKPEWLAIDVARHFAKSTYMSRFFPTYIVSETTFPKIQLVGSAGNDSSVVKENLAWIREQFTYNQLLIADYGIKSIKGNTEHITITRADDSTCDIYARGKGSDIRGARGMLIFDDLQDEGDVDSEAILATDHKWFLSDSLPILSCDDPMIFIGSALSPLSLLSQCKNSGLFKVFQFPALINDEGVPDLNGHSVWPEKHPTEFLQKIRRLQGDDIFSRNFMCKTMVSGNPVYRREWFKFWNKSKDYDTIRRQGLYVIAALDGAFSKKTAADNTAIVVLGITRDPEPNIYCLDAFQGKVGSTSAASQLYRMANQWNANMIFIETMVNPPDDNDPILKDFNNEMAGQGRRFNVQWEHPKLDKLARAFETQGAVQSGRVFFDSTDENQVKLMNEMAMFTGDQKFHDDMVDALVHAIRRGRNIGVPTKSTGPKIVRARKSRPRYDNVATM